MRPTISACIITYNHAPYVARCLEGVLAQAGDFDLEIVVSDDCSTDGTVAIARDAVGGDTRVRIISQARNLGMGANIRTAIHACKGDYIAICEGDDFWIDAMKLQRQLSVLSDPNVHLSLTAGIRVDETGRFIGSFRHIGPSRALSAEEVLAGGGGLWPTCSTVFRRNAVRSLPDELYLQPVIDWPLHVLLAAKGCAWYDSTETCAWRKAATGSWTERLQDGQRYLIHHRASRNLEAFYRTQLRGKHETALRKGFRKGILYFYAARRVTWRAKWAELQFDYERLDYLSRLAVIAFTFIPGLGELMFAIRRRLREAAAGYGEATPAAKHAGR